MMPIASLPGPMWTPVKVPCRRSKAGPSEQSARANVIPWPYDTCTSHMSIDIDMCRYTVCIYIYTFIHTQVYCTHIHILLYTYMHTSIQLYMHTYITSHHITSHHITLHYITLHYITYIYTYTYTYTHTHIHAYI